MKQSENSNVDTTSQRIQTMVKDILRKNKITSLFIIFKCVFVSIFWSIISVGLYNMDSFRELGFLGSLKAYSFHILFIFVVLLIINIGYAIIKIINLIFSSIELSTQVFAPEVSNIMKDIKEIKDNTKK